MVTSTDTEYRGRKLRVGSPVFSPTGRLNFFLGYCDNCHGKCMVTYEEAQILIKRFGKTHKKPVQRMAIRLLKKYANY